MDNKITDSSKAKKIENFDINSDYGIYTVEISKSQKEKNDCIHFKAYSKNHISSAVYQKSFNFDALLEISKVFKLCDTIDDALNIILETFKNKEVKISKDDTIYLCFYKLPTNNFNELKIPLDKSKIEDSCMIEKLCESLSQIQEKYKKLEEEVANLKLENKKLTEELSQKEGHPISESLIEIMQRKFMKSQYLLSKDLSDHLSEFGLKDDFKKEIQNRFELSKAKVIYDVKKDGDTLVGFMAKVFGKKNIATFHALHTDENYHSVQLAYLNGKLEFINNYFKTFPNYDEKKCMIKIIGGIYQIYCLRSFLNFNGPSIHFIMNGYAYKIPFDDLFEDVYTDSYNSYKLFKIEFYITEKNEWYFGTIFLKQYEVVFDADNKVMGFYGDNKYDLTKYTNEEYEVTCWYNTISVFLLFLVVIIPMIYEVTHKMK